MNECHLLGRARIQLLALTLLATSTVSQVHRQPANHGLRRSALLPQTLEQSELTLSFDPAIRQLPAHFSGHNIKLVYGSLESLIKDKSEYETTEEYQRRVSSVPSKILFGGVTPNSTLIFDSKEARGGALTTTYDADSQTLSIKLAATKTNLLLEKTEPELLEVVLSSIGESRQYTGTNAFGASVEVTSTDFEEYGIAFEPGRWPFDGPDSDDDPVALWTMSLTSDSARQLRPNLRLLFVGTLKSPWVHRDVSGQKATMDSPHETVHDQHFLHFIPEQLWLSDDSTGAVLKKLTPSVPDKRYVLEVASNGANGLVTVSTDGRLARPRSIMGTTWFRADSEIVFQIDTCTLHDMALLTFTLNGRPVTPNWDIQQEETPSIFKSAKAKFPDNSPPKASTQDDSHTLQIPLLPRRE